MSRSRSGKFVRVCIQMAAALITTAGIQAASTTGATKPTRMGNCRATRLSRACAQKPVPTHSAPPSHQPRPASRSLRRTQRTTAPCRNRAYMPSAQAMSRVDR
jgi:hypothetical protein